MDNIKSANSLTADWNELFPEIMAKGGFDCVVGNPPYVRQESIKELKPELQEIYTVFTGTADLFIYFYELAQNVLKTGGINGFICSNKFFRAKYGQNLREMILTKTTIKNIVDFNAVKVFEDATVDSTITILQKGFKVNSSFQISLNNYDNFFDMAQSDLTKDSFSFVTPDELAIKKKIEKVGTPLKEWDILMNRGITTGFNEAFVIDGAKKDELIKYNKKNIEIIKPILKGMDIQKYTFEFTNKWIVSTFPSLCIDIDNYSEVKNHLGYFEKRLEQSGEKGSRKKTKHKWFETQDIIAYWQEFSKEKIAWQRVTKEPTFSIVKANIMLLDSIAFITTKNDLYLISLLNSQLIAYYIGMITHQYGSTGYLLSNQFVERIPIPKIPKEEQKPFINLVESIIDAKEKIAKYNKHFDSLNAVNKIEIKEEIEKLEALVVDCVDEIDRLVYGLYGLSGDEVKIVESQNG
jgi:hypothetical protein